MNSSKVLVAYRHVLRSINLTFKNDTRMLTAAKFNLNQMARKNHNLEDATALESKVNEMEDIAKFLKENIVQGVSDGKDIYHLNIHSGTEINDNDTINRAKTALGSCCGSSDKH